MPSGKPNNKQINSIQEIQQLTKTKQPQISQTSSEFHQLYLDIMQKPFSLRDVHLFNQTLINHGFIVNQVTFRDTFQSQTVFTDFQSLTIQLLFGNYQFNIHVLMTQLNSSFFQQANNTDSGHFGLIYKLQYQKNDFVIKDIKLNINKFEQELNDVYQQYMMCCIASALKVGPQVSKLFGYDIIVTEASAFFAMQKCLQTDISNINKFRQQIRVNLKTLHSLKFIHSDIKPENIAYSPTYGKNVFIDFGLSKLLKKGPGHKVRSLFCGTVLYCYKQMRQAYTLGSAKFVDLYYNDVFSMEKTLENMPKKLNLIKNSYFMDSMSKQHVQTNNSNIIEDSIQILGLKYFIYTRNQSQVMNILPRIKNMQKSLFSVLNCRQTQAFLTRNSSLQQFVYSFKRKIKIQNIIPDIQPPNESKSDEIISAALQKVNENDGVSQIFPFEEIFNLKVEQFQFIMNNQEYVNKIILYLDSLTEVQNNFWKFDEKITILTKKIQKINSTNHQIYQFKKMNYLLSFIQQKLKKKRNKNNIKILRMLFIAIQNFKTVQKLEEEILELINDPAQRSLMIAEYFLLWQIRLNKFGYYKREGWLQMIENQKLQQSKKQQLDFYVKSKKLALKILNKENRFYFQKFEEEDEILILIQSFKQIGNKFAQQLTKIEILYIQYLKVDKNLVVENKLKDLKIYSKIFQGIKLSSRINKRSTQVLFLSNIQYLQTVLYQIRNEQVKFFSLLKKSDKQGKKTSKYEINKQKQFIKFIDYIFNINEERPELITEHFFILFNNINFVFHSCIFRLADKLIDAYNVFFNPLTNSLCKKIPLKFSLYTLQRSILIIIQVKFKQKENLLLKQEAKNMYKKLQVLTQLAETKINQEQCGQDFTFNHTIQNIIKVHLNYFKFGYSTELLLLINRTFLVVKSLNVLHFHNINVVIMFLELVIFLIEELPQDQIQRLQSMVEYVCQKEQKEGRMYLFERRGDFLGKMAHIYIKKRQFKKFRILIENFIEALQLGKIYFANINMHQLSLYQGLSKMPMLDGIQIYQQICHRPQELKKKFYPFYVTNIFYHSFNYLKQEDYIRQLKRTCLSLQNMCNFHALNSKRLVIDLMRWLKIIKSKRKMLIYIRIYSRYSLHHSLIDKYMSLLQKGIKNKWRMDCIKIFREKIQNLLTNIQ